MNTAINSLRRWFDLHPKWRQWGWFVLLWCAGLAAVFLLSLPFKLLIRGMG